MTDLSCLWLGTPSHEIVCPHEPEALSVSIPSAGWNREGLGLVLDFGDPLLQVIDTYSQRLDEFHDVDRGRSR